MRKPQMLRDWLKSYAAATATTASYTTILNIATPGQSNKPTRKTTISYRDVLHSLWLIDEVPPWGAALGSGVALTQTPKHFLADPALAACLLGLDSTRLTHGVPDASLTTQYGSITGRFFEALVALDLLVFADACDAEVTYLRTSRGDHEVDFIVSGDNGCLAVEVKLSPSVSDGDVRHLTWLASHMGRELVDAMVITTGSRAYRRAKDGIAVVPAVLLGL